MNFVSKKLNRINAIVPVLFAVAAATTIAGCSSKEPGTATQSYKGVINLEGVRLGLPEESAKSAILTFVADPSVSTNVTQYLSRVYDKNNGQYCLAYYKGNPFQLRVVYNQAPISKEDALAKLKAILPASAPEEPTKVSAGDVGKKDAPIETRMYGDSLRIELMYADKAGTTVKTVSATQIPAEVKGGAKGGDADKAADSDKKAE